MFIFCYDHPSFLILIATCLILSLQAQTAAMRASVLARQKQAAATAEAMKAAMIDIKKKAAEEKAARSAARKSARLAKKPVELEEASTSSGITSSCKKGKGKADEYSDIDSDSDYDDDDDVTCVSSAMSKSLVIR